MCTWQGTPTCTLTGTAGPGLATAFIRPLIWRPSAGPAALSPAPPAWSGSCGWSVSPCERRGGSQDRQGQARPCSSGLSRPAGSVLSAEKYEDSQSVSVTVAHERSVAGVELCDLGPTSLPGPCPRCGIAAPSHTEATRAHWPGLRERTEPCRKCHWACLPPRGLTPCFLGGAPPGRLGVFSHRALGLWGSLCGSWSMCSAH